MKKHNFNPGPAILPAFAIEKTKEAVENFAGTGLSILEVSHRSKEFDAIVVETVEYFKRLLDIPAGYSVIFVGGGASTQFFTVPYNLLNKKAAYLKTGSWAAKAAKEAKLFGEVEIVASSEDKKYNYIPKGWTVPEDADYFHITTNNTIYGTEIRTDYDVKVPLVADMSSDLFSRPVDIAKYGLIYAGAQKNFGPAGVTAIILRDDILGKVERPLPSMVNYATHIKGNSLYNTPPVICLFTVLQTLKWLESIGGVKEIEKRNIEKAKLVYDEIDRNKMFVGTAEADSRSLMNATYVMTPGYEEFDKEFLELLASKGIVGVKGHRDVGGFRASLYNALPIESAKLLVETMKEFEAKH